MNTARDIDIREIEVGDRVRGVDPGYVGLLMDSIGTVGLLQPIQVRANRAGAARPFRLVGGAHRLAACTSLGMAAVPAIVVTLDEVEARIAEIDENLYRHDLTALDRAISLAERKELWEALHPDTRWGGDRKSPSTKGKNQTDNDVHLNFASAAAARSGLTPRSIRRAVHIAEHLDPELRRALTGTWLADHQAQLAQLVQVARPRQRAVAERMLRPEARVRNVAAALAELDGRPAESGGGHERTFLAFRRLWNAAGKRARLAIVRWVLETPEAREAADE